MFKETGRVQTGDSGLLVANGVVIGIACKKVRNVSGTFSANTDPQYNLQNRQRAALKQRQ